MACSSSGATSVYHPAEPRRPPGALAQTPPLPEKVLEPGPWMMRNQIAKTSAQTAAVTAKIRPSARALVVPGGAAYEDPGVVQPPQQRERAEQQHEQRDERDQDADSDAPREVVGLRAEPQAGDRDGAPAEQAAEGDRGEQQAREGAVHALAQIAAALGQRAEAHRGGAGRRPTNRPPLSEGSLRMSPCSQLAGSDPLSRRRASRTGPRISR